MANIQSRTPLLIVTDKLKKGQIPPEVLRDPKSNRTRRFFANNMWKRDILSRLGNKWVTCTDPQNLIDGDIKVVNHQKGIDGIFKSGRVDMIDTPNQNELVDLLIEEGLEDDDDYREIIMDLASEVADSTIFIVSFRHFKFAALIRGGRIVKYGSVRDENLGDGLEVLKNIDWDTETPGNKNWEIKCHPEARGKRKLKSRSNRQTKCGTKRKTKR